MTKTFDLLLLSKKSNVLFLMTKSINSKTVLPCALGKSGTLRKVLIMNKNRFSNILSIYLHKGRLNPELSQDGSVTYVAQL
jgi:hypothetical protein